MTVPLHGIMMYCRPATMSAVNPAGRHAVESHVHTALEGGYTGTFVTI